MAQTITYNNFVGGLWLPVATSVETPQNSLYQALNVEYYSSPANEGGNIRIRGRRGRTKYNATPLAGLIYGIIRHYPRTGNPATLVAYLNGSNVNFAHDTADNGTFATPTGNFNAGVSTDWQGVSWPQKNNTYIANGTSDGIRAYNGVISSVITATGVTVDGPYLSVWQGRLWATKSNELNYSWYASDINDETNFDSANHLALNDVGGGLITGGCPSPNGDFFVMMKQNSGWNFSGDIGLGTGTLREFTPEGCVASRTLRRTPFGIFYLSKRGLLLSDGVSQEGIEVSAPLRSLFVSATGQNTYSLARGNWFPRKQQYWLKLDPSHTYVYVCSRIAVLNPNTGKPAGSLFLWAKYDEVPFHTSCVWTAGTDDGKMLSAGSGASDGQIWQLDTGTKDDGTDFNCTVQSNLRLLMDDHRVGRANWFMVDYQGSKTLSAGLRYNQVSSNDVSITLGAVQSLSVQRINQRVNNYTASGQRISWVLTNTGDGPNFELYGVGIEPRFRSGRLWR